jgi:hypothetical protein
MCLTNYNNYIILLSVGPISSRGYVPLLLGQSTKHGCVV